MQLLAAKCPYCAHSVETTLDHVSEPIMCTNCHRPFEMEIPSVEVTSVRDIDDQSVGKGQIASDPEERTIETVHPAVLRAHLLGSLIVFAVAALAVTGMVMSLFGEGSVILSWICSFALLACVLVVGYWFILSLATTLTITTSRTMVRRGIIRKETSEVQHDDVRNIQVHQNMIQRLFHIGGLGISSSGQDDLEVTVKGMPDPEHLVSIIRQNQT